MSHRENKKPWVASGSAFFERVPLGCVLTDLRGVISEPTLSAARMIGCNVGDLLGRSLAEFVLRAERPAFQQAIERVVQTCDPITLITPLERADGTITVATYTVQVTTDHNDRPAELLWLIEGLVDFSQSGSLELDEAMTV